MPAWCATDHDRVSTIATATSISPRGRPRPLVRRFENGAAAIRVIAKSLPPIPAQASVRCNGSLPSTGAIANASVVAAVAVKPPQSSRSSRRPSTEKRIPASTATIPAASMTAVSSTRRTCGSA